MCAPGVFHPGALSSDSVLIGLIHIISDSFSSSSGDTEGILEPLYLMFPLWRYVVTMTSDLFEGRMTYE